MPWTWDPDKAAINLKKHAVSFQLAERVFDDPYCLVMEDPYPFEERWRTLGRPDPIRSILLIVVHTWSDDHEPGRIISAREATSHERRAHEEDKP